VGRGALAASPDDFERVSFDHSPDPDAGSGIGGRRAPPSAVSPVRPLLARLGARYRRSPVDSIVWTRVAETVPLRTRISEGLPGGYRRSSHERKPRSDSIGHRPAEAQRMGDARRVVGAIWTLEWHAFHLRQSLNHGRDRLWEVAHCLVDGPCRDAPR
jgi:hypothetical protein